ncbi:MAG TPA: MarR family winged helix-turn-helix transcriptional regulator [Limnochordia bacterium]|nr:MarR family winged helix-turn-helix transcriptional regulator [Limnochordia bacterium]
MSGIQAGEPKSSGAAPGVRFAQGDAAHQAVTALAKIGLALRHQAWASAESHALTPTQGQILTLLQARAPEGARLAELAAGLAVSPPTASVAVQALVEKGLVAKARAADDARALEIRLTDAGRAEAARTANWTDFLLGAVAALDEAEQAVFLRSLLKMIAHLQARGEIPVTRMCTSCTYFRPNAHPGAAKPHHCAFVDAPFGDAGLRFDCPDHEPAAAPALAVIAAALAGRRS